MNVPSALPSLSTPAEPQPGAQQFRTAVTLYLLGTLGIVFLYLATAFCESEQLSSWANMGLPIAYGLLCSGTAVHVLSRQPLMIWSPFIWFLGTNILYFSVGVLVLKFGHEASIADINRYYRIDEDDLLRTNTLNCIGGAGVAAGLLAGSSLFPVRPSPTGNPGISPRLKIVVLLCLAVGLVVKYGFVMPYAFGFTSYILPGSILQLQSLTSFSIIVLIIFSHRDSPAWRAILYPLMTSEILASLLTFGKKNLLETLIAILLGYFMLRPTKRMMLGGAALLGVTYLVSVNLVRYGRSEIIAETGTHYEATLEKRLEILSAYIKKDSSEFKNEAKQAWWTRLCYSNAQSFAMDQYDGGHPGDTFELAWYVLIPRVLWPEKPLMVSGSQFNYLVTGNPYGQSAPGFFAEAYWNGGWLFAGLSALFLGVLFSVFTKHALEKIGHLQLVYLPCALLGMTIGYRPDDWYIATVIGGSVTGLLSYLGLKFLTGAYYRGLPAQQLAYKP